MKFEFATAGKILFGNGVSDRLPEILSNFGSKGMVFLAKHLEEENTRVHALLEKSKVKFLIQTVREEPTAFQVDAAAASCQKYGAEFILAIGGGSVMDFGKAVAMLTVNGGETLDYIEVIGRGKKITKPSLPVIAIPTTAGTGSEVTKNSVVKLPDLATKASLRHESMLPRVAIIDPTWTVSASPEVTASTGFDAITQVVEPYLSVKANWIVDSLCLEAIRMGIEALPKCYSHPDDLDAREKMAYVSMIGGIALANAGLGAVHAFAAALGGMTELHHGDICACLLPVTIQQNTKALEERDPENQSLKKICRLNKHFTENGMPDEGSFVGRLKQLQRDVHIKTVHELGIRLDQFDETVEKALNTSSMKGNPILLTTQEMKQILKLS